MGELHPLRLANLLADLNVEVERWRLEATETMSVSEYSQRHMQEEVTRVEHDARRAWSQLEDDWATYRSTDRDLQSLEGRCSDATSDATHLSSDVQTLVQTAQQAQDRWENELALAQAWEQKALNRVATAEAELSRAHDQLNAANAALRSAVQALQRCQSSYTTDRNGQRVQRDCSSLHRAVASAQADVARAERRVYAAKQELKAAQTELVQAQARVRHCEEAVSTARNAVRIAQSAHQHSIQAGGAAENAAEESARGRQALNAAEGLLQVEEEKTRDMLDRTRRAREDVDTAQMHMRRADREKQRAHTYSARVEKEFSEKRDALLALNTPDLNL